MIFKQNRKFAKKNQSLLKINKIKTKKLLKRI